MVLDQEKAFKFLPCDPLQMEKEGLDFIKDRYWYTDRKRENPICKTC
jgi:hypothetical protein